MVKGNERHGVRGWEAFTVIAGNGLVGVFSTTNRGHVITIAHCRGPPLLAPSDPFRIVRRDGSFPAGARRAGLTKDAVLGGTPERRGSQRRKDIVTLGLVEGLTIERATFLHPPVHGEQPPLARAEIHSGPARWFRRFLVWPTSRLDRLAHGRRASAKPWSWSRAAHVAHAEKKKELIPESSTPSRCPPAREARQSTGWPSTWRWRFTRRGRGRHRGRGRLRPNVR